MEGFNGQIYAEIEVEWTRGRKDEWMNGWMEGWIERGQRRNVPLLYISIYMNVARFHSDP